MATSGRPVDELIRRDIERRLNRGESVYRTAREAGVSEPTVRKIRKSLLTSFGNASQ
jgi:DNA-binding CsgD family transcriptional regulator